MGGKATQQVLFAEVEIALWYASLAVTGVALQTVVVLAAAGTQAALMLVMVMAVLLSWSYC